MSTFCGIDRPRSDKYKLEILFVNVTSGLAAQAAVISTQDASKSKVSPIVVTF